MKKRLWRDEKGAAAIQCSPTKEHGFGYLREHWPWQPLLCVLWILFVFVSTLGLEAYFLCEHLMKLRMSSVRHGAFHTRTCSHGAPWSSAPSPSAPFTLLPSPFFLSLVSGFSRFQPRAQTCAENPSGQCSRSIVSKGGALRSGKRPLGTLTVCLK